MFPRRTPDVSAQDEAQLGARRRILIRPQVYPGHPGLRGDRYVKYDSASGELQEEIDRAGWGRNGVGASYCLSQLTPMDLVLFTRRPFATDDGHSRWEVIESAYRVPYEKFLPCGAIGMNRVTFSEDGKLLAVFGKNLGSGYRKDVILCRGDEAKYRFHYRLCPNSRKFDAFTVLFAAFIVPSCVSIVLQPGGNRTCSGFTLLEKFEWP